MWLCYSNGWISQKSWVKVKSWWKRCHRRGKRSFRKQVSCLTWMWYNFSYPMEEGWAKYGPYRIWIWWFDSINKILFAQFLLSLNACIIHSNSKIKRIKPFKILTQVKVLHPLMCLYNFHSLYNCVLWSINMTQPNLGLVHILTPWKYQPKFRIFYLLISSWFMQELLFTLAFS